MKRGYDAHRGNGPCEDRTVTVAQEIEQLCRNRKILRRYDLHRGAAGDRRIDILNGDIKVERCLVPEIIRLIKTECLRKDIDKIDNRAMTYNDALGNAGRAGCEIAVERIDIQSLRSDLFKKIVIFRLFGCRFKIFQIPDTAIKTEFRDLFVINMARYNKVLLKSRKNVKKSCTRLLCIKQRVKAAGINSSKKHADCIDTLSHKDRNRFPRFFNYPMEGTTESSCSLHKFSVCDFFVRIGKSYFVRIQTG